MPVPLPSVPQMIGKLRDWIGSDHALSLRLGCAGALLPRWEKMEGKPDAATLRFMEVLYRTECGRHTHALLSDFGHWGHHDNKIAVAIPVHPTAVFGWRTGTIPTWEHLLALESLHAKARSEFIERALELGQSDFSHRWAAMQHLEFLCSIAPNHLADHSEQAMAALARSNESNRTPDRQRGFAFRLDVRSEELPAAVRGHAYIDRRGPKLGFVVLLNSLDSWKQQRETLLNEISAHVFKQFPCPEPAAEPPRSVLRNRSPRKGQPPPKS